MWAIVTMKFFTKKELKVIFLIFFIMSVVSFFNFRVSIRRERDSQRKNTMGELLSALQKYHDYSGVYPLSSPDGKILACKTEDTFYDKEEKEWKNLRPCEWGVDSLFVIYVENNPVVMETIATDPKSSEGIFFTYFSNGDRFQILAHLEGEDEPEFDLNILKRNIGCGNEICNYGRASGDTPLDLSIEEYENELSEILKKENE